MRVLVCGSRHWNDPAPIWAVLAGLYARDESADGLIVIEGGAPGADSFAAEWADDEADGSETYPADWDKHGKAAGPIRNQQMLDEGQPDVVYAFKDAFDLAQSGSGRGTEDMVRRAKAAGVPVYLVSHV